ncbi:MAG: HD domain-containing protein [Candidatus Promineifilaceae bacterium]
MSLTFSPLLARIRPVLGQQSQPVFLVGGAVRDALLGRTSHDLDFTVATGAVKLAFKVADSLGVPAYVMDRERDVGRVVLPDEKTTLDFARFRNDDLESDLRDRDFTINAIAMPVLAEETADVLVDPTGGQQDLRDGVVRQVHDKALVDDPVRALRAVRMAVSLDFTITPETESAVTAATALFDQVSIERIRDELVKLFRSKNPDKAARFLARLSVLPVVLPEIAQLQGVEQSAPHFEDVFAHTCSVLRWLSLLEESVIDGRSADHPAVVEIEQGLSPFAAQLRAHWSRPVTGELDGRILLRLAGLFHDCGKRATQVVEENGRIRFFGHDRVGAKLAGSRLRRLRLSNEAIDYVKLAVANHMRPLLLSREPRLSRRAVFRFFKSAGTAGLDVVFLALADNLATYDGRDEDGNLGRMLAAAEVLYRHYFEQYEETIRPPMLLDGNQLMKVLGLGPGRQVGRLLALIQEAQAAGEVATREEAVELARKQLGE